jgi:hypothetical protein
VSCSFSGNSALRLSNPGRPLNNDATDSVLIRSVH